MVLFNCTDRCFYYFVHHIYINEDRLNDHKVKSTPEQLNIHDGRIYFTQLC